MLCESPIEIDYRRVDSPFSTSDSPMNGAQRHSGAQPLDHPEQPHGPRMARKEASTASSSSSGFTAVNGGDTIVVAIPSKSSRANVQPSLRMTDLTTELITPTESSPDQPKASHGWRPTDVPVSKTNGHAAEPTKRKRGETLAEDNRSPIDSAEPADTSGPQTQKRRLVVTTETPADLSSAHVSPEEATRSAVERRSLPYPTERRSTVYSREPSPMASHSAVPRPVARPETVADLAASLRRELHGDSLSPTQHSPIVANNDSTSPTADNRFSPEAQTPPSPDNAGQNNEDSKKRKRMFSNRTKTGCHTCRQRKKKCDERKPFCQNCERGGFQCTGYGAKPPNIKPVGTAQRAIALQSKPLHDPAYAHGPPLYHYPPHDGRPYPPWPGGPPPEHDPHRPVDPRHARYYEPPPWAHRPPWHGMDPHTAPLHPHHAPPPPAAGPPPPPPPSLPPSLPPSHHPSERDRPRHMSDIPPPPPPFHSHSGDSLRPSLGPGPPSLGGHGMYDDPWASSHTLPPPIRSTNLQGASSRDSIATSGSSGRAMYSQVQLMAKQDRKDMILGKAFLYYSNQTLLNDRQACRGALERYNDAAKPSSYVSAEERGRFFRAVVDPTVRPQNKETDAIDMPCGDVGRETVVESPFNCDFGYNIHLGQEVVIQPGCYMQDPCEIRIGNRTMIGPNVRFYGLTASLDPSCRKGIRSRFYGGSIIVEEDCLIGADVIIMPFRKIGRGAIVGAGSVVTRDVQPDTVVAGNPARIIRDLRDGRSLDRHADERIQRENDRMLRDMQTSWEIARERAR